jgi:hypothetical protein
MPANEQHVARVAYIARVSEAYWTLDFYAGNLERRRVSYVTPAER